VTEDEMREAAKAQNKKSILQFMDDMDNAGLEMRYYRGRFYWEGPAVVVENLQDALSETKVRCNWDSIGLDKVVYTRESLDRIDATPANADRE
jgi:hypothetical protein